MANVGIPEYRISVDQLRPGVFIRLERMGWFTHPFLFNSFKIREQSQIDVLRELGVREVICVPEKSDVLPLKADDAVRVRQTAVTAPSKSTASATTLNELWALKKEHTRRLREKRERIAKSEQRFAGLVKDYENLRKRVVLGDAHALDEMLAFVDRISAHYGEDAESSIHLMNVVSPEDQIYSHSLNVAVLSMMAARELGLNVEQMRTLGVGALFHDIGKTRMEKKLLRKRGGLTRAERALMEKHPAYGSEILGQIEGFPSEALPIVEQHHERFDGSGYPAGLRGVAQNRLARIVAVADAYDNYCNNHIADESLTPYLALSYMFSQHQRSFDADILAVFIRCLGVYPPGTVVQLTNGSIGMVMSVNPRNQLLPSVVLYDSEVPRREALIVDLECEPDLRVEKSIRLAHLPQEIFDYLNPRTRISYYVDGA